MCEFFCATEDFTVDCMIVCCNVGIFNFGSVKFGWIGEILRCASVVVIVSTISSFTKCDGVCISCCVRFVVPFKLSLFKNVEFKLFFPVLSGKNEL